MRKHFIIRSYRDKVRLWDRLWGQSGVYFYLDKDQRVLYIGSSGNLARRLKEHELPDGVETRILEDWSILVNSTADYKSIEKNLIEKYQPPYNGVGISSYYGYLPKLVYKRIEQRKTCAVKIKEILNEKLKHTIRLLPEASEKLRLYAAKHRKRLNEVIEELIEKNL